jgi:hypothetical protein
MVTPQEDHHRRPCILPRRPRGSRGRHHGRQASSTDTVQPTHSSLDSWCCRPRLATSILLHEPLDSDLRLARRCSHHTRARPVGLSSLIVTPLSFRAIAESRAIGTNRTKFCRPKARPRPMGAQSLSNMPAEPRRLARTRVIGTSSLSLAPDLHCDFLRTAFVQASASFEALPVHSTLCCVPTASAVRSTLCCAP